MIARSLIVAMFSVILASCASQPKVKSKKELPREELPPLEVGLPNEANVRFPPVTKAYAVNRYIDPANPNLLHERHVVYRREDGDRWMLDASRKQQVIVGPVLTDSRMERQPAPLTRELADDIRKARTIEKQYQEALAVQRRSQEQIVTALSNLANATTAINTRLRAVESKSKEATVQVSGVRAQASARPPMEKPKPVADDSMPVTEGGTFR